MVFVDSNAGLRSVVTKEGRPDLTAENAKTAEKGTEGKIIEGKIIWGIIIEEI